MYEGRVFNAEFEITVRNSKYQKRDLACEQNKEYQNCVEINN